MRLRNAVMLGLFALSDLAFTQTTPDIVLSGVLTGSQVQHSYIELPFTVPAGMERVSVTFAFTGHSEQNTQLSLGMEDPDRLRGWSGGNKSAFTIGVSDATPSYLPGPIVPGTWKLLIGVANLRPTVKSEYKAVVHLTPDGKAGVEGFSDTPLSSEAEWYRGDLHMHTAHSDGSCASESGKQVPCPMFVTAEAAAARGLDFIAITDHNTTSHYDEERELQPYFDRMLFIPGREMTTFVGHTNFYGSTHFVDFRVDAPGYPDMDSMFRAGHALGEIVSINHPVRPGGEVCIGCRWEPSKMNMSLVDAIEAINGPAKGQSGPLHAADIAFWETQLNAGYRITAIGGSDTHRPQEKTTGEPTTVVYAQELSVPAILAGIKAGHVFIDLAGTRDRGMEMTAAAAGTTVKMGDTMKAPAGTSVHIALRVLALPAGTVQFIEDGKPLPRSANSAVTTAGQTVNVDIPSDGKSHWVRANVLDAQGALALLGNPVYLNYEEKH